MDGQGRLHMGKFVGETFEETGLKPRNVDTSSRTPGLEPELGMNRKTRRAAEAMQRAAADRRKALA